MSQLTTAKIDLVAIDKEMIRECSRIANDIWNRLNKKVDLKGINASKLKELDDILSPQKLKNPAEEKDIRSQIDKVREAMKKVKFLNLNDQEKINLEKELVIKYTDVANLSDSKDIQYAFMNENIIIHDAKWNNIIEKAQTQKIDKSTNRIFQSFSEVCRGLNFVEKEKVIKPGGNSDIKLTDKFGHCVTMVTETKKGKTKMSIEPSGYDTKTKECGYVTDKILKGLKKKGLSLYDVKILDHNNQSGLLNIQSKKKATRVLDLVNGTLKKSSAKRLANTQKTRLLK